MINLENPTITCLFSLFIIVRGSLWSRFIWITWKYIYLYLFLKRWRSQLMWRVFFTSAIVAVVVRTAMGWCKSGKCGHFGSGGFIIWDVSGWLSEPLLDSITLHQLSDFLPFLVKLLEATKHLNQDLFQWSRRLLVSGVVADGSYRCYWRPSWYVNGHDRDTSVA